MPPVQRVLAAPRTVAEQGFGAMLATHQNPSFGGELGHAVRASAPGGLLHGVLTPVAGRPGDLDLPSLQLPVRGAGEAAAGTEGQTAPPEA
ncbi:hypothetical protein G3I28_35435, partial [Streptomyces sp. SID10116]|nr:hypothetical protein [Streptomyces sp. SID10116]